LLATIGEEVGESFGKTETGKFWYILIQIII
jgi:hypothetical protein